MRVECCSVLLVFSVLLSCGEDDAPFDLQGELDDTLSTVFLNHPRPNSTHVSLGSLELQTVSVRVLQMFYNDFERSAFQSDIESNVKIFDHAGRGVEAEYDLGYEQGRPYYDVHITPTQGWVDGDYEVRIKDPKKSNIETSYYFSTLSKPVLFSIWISQKDNIATVSLETSEIVTFTGQVCMNNDCVSANDFDFNFSQVDLSRHNVLKISKMVANTSDELKPLAVKNLPYSQDADYLYINLEPSKSIQCDTYAYCYE